MKFSARAWIAGLLTAVLAVVAVAIVSAQQRREPLTTFLFGVEINGQSVGFFKSVSGLEMETEVTEYREGGDNTGTIRKFPGVTRYSNIRLTRTFTGDRYLYDWFRSSSKPNPVRVTGRIFMVDRQGTEIAAWKFVNGFPAKWEGPDFDAGKNELAIESIEIAHEGLVLLPDDNDDGQK